MGVRAITTGPANPPQLPASLPSQRRLQLAARCMMTGRKAQRERARAESRARNARRPAGQPRSHVGQSERPAASSSTFSCAVYERGPAWHLAHQARERGGHRTNTGPSGHGPVAEQQTSPPLTVPSPRFAVQARPRAPCSGPGASPGAERQAPLAVAALTRAGEIRAGSCVRRFPAARPACATHCPCSCPSAGASTRFRGRLVSLGFPTRGKELGGAEWAWENHPDAGLARATAVIHDRLQNRHQQQQQQQQHKEQCPCTETE